MSRVVKKVIIGFGIALGVVGLIAIGYVAANWKTPLAPPIDYSTVAVTVAPEDVVTAAPTQTPEPPTETPTAIPPTATPTPAPVCGGPESMLLLGIGTDSRGNNYLYGLADVIRIVRADFVKQEISVLSLPRDLWVQVPGIEAHGITEGKLSQAYFWNTEGMRFYTGPGEEALGAGLLARTLEHNFGLQVEHYAVANMAVVAGMIDAIGGVYIYVPADLDGRYIPTGVRGEWLGYYLEPNLKNGYFTAGEYHMNGEIATLYASVRGVDTEFKRQERQYQVLYAIRDQALRPDVLEKIPELINVFKGSIRTDLSLEQLGQLACLSVMLEEDDIHLQLMAESFFEAGWAPGGYWALFADEAQMRAGMAAFVETGRWPAEFSGSPSD